MNTGTRETLIQGNKYDLTALRERFLCWEGGDIPGEGYSLDYYFDSTGAYLLKQTSATITHEAQSKSQTMGPKLDARKFDLTSHMIVMAQLESEMAQLALDVGL